MLILLFLTLTKDHRSLGCMMDMVVSFSRNGFLYAVEAGSQYLAVHTENAAWGGGGGGGRDMIF